MVGREIHIHDVSSAGFSEAVYLSLQNQDQILQVYVSRFLKWGMENERLK